MMMMMRMVVFCAHHRDSKVTMLLQESLGNINCHTTVLAHVTDSLEHFPETFSTVQIASRIRRTQKKANVCLLNYRLLTITFLVPRMLLKVLFNEPWVA